MKIVSAKYQKDQDGNINGVVIITDDGKTCTAPYNGTTWVNTALTQWQKEGGEIATDDA